MASLIGGSTAHLAKRLRCAALTSVVLTVAPAGFAAAETIVHYDFDDGGATFANAPASIAGHVAAGAWVSAIGPVLPANGSNLFNGSAAHGRLTQTRRSPEKSGRFASQLPVGDWHEYLGGGRLADAILDRLVHNAHRIELASKESMRRARRS
jgi:hypothetical protein